MPKAQTKPYYAEYRTLLKGKLQTVKNEVSQLTLDRLSPELAFFNAIRQGITRHPLREYQQDALYILHHIYQYAHNALTVPDVLRLKEYRHIKPLLEVIDPEQQTRAPFIGFEMATGSGKTMLMGATIYYLNQIHNIKNFLIITPSSTEIYKKTIRNFTIGSAESVWAEDTPFRFNLITGDNYKERNLFDNLERDATIFVFNIDKFGANATNTLKQWEASIWKDNDGNTISLREYLSLSELAIITDEAHHAQNRKSSNIIKLFKPNAVLEFTATAVETSQAKDKKNQTVVYKYDIRRFLDDRYGKLVRVLALSADERKGRATEISDVEKQKLQTFFLVHLVKKKALQLDPYTRALKSLGFVKVKNEIPYAERIERYIKEELAADTENLQFILDQVKKHDLETTNLIQAMFEQDYHTDLAQLQQAIGQIAQSAILLHSKSEPLVQKQFATIQTNNVEIVIYINMLDEGIDMPNIYTMVVINDTVTEFKTAVKQIVGRGVRLNKEQREFDDVRDQPLLTHTEKLHIICDEGKAFQEVIEEIQKEFGLNDKLFGSERGQEVTVENNSRSDKLKGIYLPKIKVDFKRRAEVSIMDIIRDVETIAAEYQRYNCFSFEEDSGATHTHLKFTPAAFFKEVDLFADMSRLKEIVKEQHWKSAQLCLTDKEVKKIYGRIIPKLTPIPDVPATYKVFQQYAERLNQHEILYHYLDASDHILALNRLVDTFVYFYIHYIEDKYFTLDLQTLDAESDLWNLHKVFQPKTIKLREKEVKNTERKLKDEEKIKQLIGQNFYFFGYEHAIYEYNKFDSYPEKQLADYVNYLVQQVPADGGNDLFWVRNERDVYFEYGSHKYYPDFIFFYDDIIYVIEIKGEHIANFKKSMLLVELDNVAGMGNVKRYRGLVIFSLQMAAMKDNYLDFQTFIAQTEAVLQRYALTSQLMPATEVPDQEKYVTCLPVYTPEKAYNKFVQKKEVKIDGWLQVEKKAYPHTVFITRVQSYDLTAYPANSCIILNAQVGQPADLQDKIVLIRHAEIEDDAYKNHLTIRKFKLTQEKKPGTLFPVNQIYLFGDAEGAEGVTIADQNCEIVGVEYW